MLKKKMQKKNSFHHVSSLSYSLIISHHPSYIIKIDESRLKKENRSKEKI